MAELTKRVTISIEDYRSLVGLAAAFDEHKRLELLLKTDEASKLNRLLQSILEATVKVSEQPRSRRSKPRSRRSR